MTKAICLQCGAMKFGAFVKCPQCGIRPVEDEDAILSLAMTDHYFNEATMGQMAETIKAGSRPNLEADTRDTLLKSLHEFKKTGPGRLLFGQDRPVKPRQRRFWPF